jgi:L-lactate utilization protein LutB
MYSDEATSAREKSAFLSKDLWKYIMLAIMSGFFIIIEANKNFKSERKFVLEHKISTLIENLDKRNIKGYFIRTREEFFPLLKELIPENSSIGCGDSVTLEELGVFDFLRKENVTFYDKFQSGLTKEEKRKIYLKNFSADTFISGTNAISLDGAIFNIDGNGSRVAPMLYGPNQVILIVGINKVTPDIDFAIKRAILVQNYRVVSIVNIKNVFVMILF